MSRILNIETATEICSVCIAEGGKILAVRETSEGRNHAVSLAVFIRDIFNDTGLKADDLDAVAVSMGPGSYTGLRIGVSTAKGICYAAGLPLLAVNSLESMFTGMLRTLHSKDESIPRNSLFLPMIDARRMEVYTAGFNQKGETELETHVLVVKEDSFIGLLKEHHLYLFGSGADKLVILPKHTNLRKIVGFSLSSVWMIPLSEKKFDKQQFEDLAYFEPFYLKDFITTVPKKKLF